MKTKEFKKVLTLNKITVSDLNSGEMNAAKGGYYYTNFNATCVSWCGCQSNYYHCPTNWTYCCPVVDPTTV